MITFKNENIRPFDVDGNLILPADHSELLNKHIYVKDAITGREIEYRIHEPTVRLLKEELHRGSLVIVWSRSGYEWAASVLTALGLNKEKNIVVMSKPLVYFDDIEISQWLKDRVFLDPNVPYKT